MPRKKRVRVSAPVRRIMEEAGYSQRSAAELLKDLKQREGNHKVSAKHAARVAQERKEEFVRQSRLGVTRTGKKYLARLETAEQARKDLAAMGIAIPDLIDLAEAAAEGRYEEALKLNKQAVEKAKRETEAAIDERKQELSHLQGDARAEALEDINYLQKRLDSIVDMYGSGTAMNLKNTKAGRLIDQMFG